MHFVDSLWNMSNWEMQTLLKPVLKEVNLKKKFNSDFVQRETEFFYVLPDSLKDLFWLIALRSQQMQAFTSKKVILKSFYKNTTTLTIILLTVLKICIKVYKYPAI